MSAKPTPGPWAVTAGDDWWSASHDGTGSSEYQVVRSADGVVALVVSHTASVWRRPPPTDANARLIAAAPDLLEALQISRQFMSIASDWNIDEAEINGEMRSTYDWLEIVDAAIAKAKGEA